MSDTKYTVVCMNYDFYDVESMNDMDSSECKKWFLTKLNGNIALTKKYMSLDGISCHDPILVEGAKYFKSQGWISELYIDEIIENKYIVIAFVPSYVDRNRYEEKSIYTCIFTPHKLKWYSITENEFCGNEIISFSQDFKFTDEQRTLLYSKIEQMKVPRELQLFGVTEENKKDYFPVLVDAFLQNYNSRNSRLLIDTMKQFPNTTEFGKYTYKITSTSSTRYSIFNNVYYDFRNIGELVITDDSPEWVFINETL